MQHNEKAKLKIQEDPWDNYLYYDSRYMLPLICHAKSLSIEQQVIVCLFLQLTARDQTISQFKSSSSKLVNDLIEYVDKTEDDEEMSLLARKNLEIQKSTSSDYS